MKFRKTMATLLSVVMLFTFFTPFTVSAEVTPVISVESVTDIAGATVNVDVTIENNPGILGATLTLTYDDGLTLVNATEGEAFSALMMTKPGAFTSPCNFLWDGQEINAGNIKDGTILSLKFKISENANAGDEYAVNLSYASGDIFDANVQPIDIAINSGSISIVDYLPGDLNGDRTVNSGDIILLRRHVAGGYQQTINESAGDVNSDGKQNSGDIILIRRYVAGGYPDVILKPSKPLCNHIMNEVPYNAPTCLENGNIAYWSCSRCNKLYSDKNGITAIKQEDTVINASGHTIVIDPAIKPTYDSTGLTEGRHCSVCSTVTVEQIVLPPLEKENYSITYYIDNNDEYLKSIVVDNPNPYSYSKEDGLVLQDLIVDGYNFVGWYTAQTGGERVTEIKAGETGNKTLYAHWEKVTYTISFASDMVPVNSISYSVGEERPLTKPILDKYTFVGWTDKNGKIWDSIPAGTIGNITLYANWSSNRNQAKAVSKLAEPLIYEDTENGLILFTYEIGEIKNVPLFTTLNLQCANGIISTVSQTETQEISSTNAKSIAKTISNATTNSASWSLENSWNNCTEVSQTYLDQTGLTREEVETSVKTDSNTYNLTSSEGGSEDNIHTDSGSFKKSGNVAHSDTTTSEKEESVELSVDASLKAGFAEVNAGVNKNKTEKESTAGTDSWSVSAEDGKSKSDTKTDSKTWNETSGFSMSSSVSQSKAVSDTVSKLISEEYGYGASYAEGGVNSEAQELAWTDTESNEYSSTVTYYTSKIESKTKTFSSTGNTNGGYRMVMAGTVHVFGVVGYDVAEKSYFVYTYNVLDDKTEEYLDYSFDGTFNDYETSIIPFEIPYFVNEYVNSKIAKSDEFAIDPDTGEVVSFNNVNQDSVVFVPTYIAVDNNDETFSSMCVSSISSNLFRNNTDIIAVSLGDHITEIPDNAFEGCSSLEYIYCPGVTKIGDNVFKGCTSLSKFVLPTNVTELGENAFEGVPEIKVIASNADVAQRAASSGADNIVLDISSILPNEVNNMSFEVDNITSFELQGKDKEYKGLSVKSDAITTVINGITFTENTKIPMEFNSENVTLDRVTVDCTGYAAVLKADTTNLLLNRTINLNSSSDNAIVAKNVTFAPLNSGIVGKINVNGNVLVCGNIDDSRNCLNVSNGEIVYITDEEFENYINSHRVSFDANGGTVSEASRMVAMNSTMGELPIPTRDYYTFYGWYTEQDGGEEITSESVMTSLTDITLYAHWVQNDVSAWTLATEVPEDAEVVDRKWTYTLTSYAESHSSSMSGWTQYDSTSEWSAYGNWSGWQDSKVNGSDSRQVETRSVVSGYNKKTQWHYHRYRNSSGTRGWPIQGTDTPNLQNSGWLDYQLEYQGVGSSSGYKQYGKGAIDGCPIYWYNEQTRQVDNTNSPIYKTQYRYRDRSLIYTYYYKKDENKESTTYPTGNDISNIQEYVQYRTK